jgi:uncharacterized Zn-binding protein involved in type VI secretion
MGLPAAKQGDLIQARDTHTVIEIETGAPNQVVLPFAGPISAGLSPNVRIMGLPAATVGSVAINLPPHLPPPGTGFKSPPLNRGTILIGSETVRINGRPAARAGDTAMTCNDPTDLPIGRVQAEGTVSIG